MAEDVMVLNDYGLTSRTRTTKSGKTRTRYTVTIKSEPLLVNTNPRALSKGPATAMAELLKQRIKDITAQAAPATIAARQRAAKAVAAGASWATRRYSGGRLGVKAPGQSDRLFNDSGRFADSIAVGATGSGWTINVAANRLDPSTLDGGQAGLVKVMERLRQYVPEWGDARMMATSIPVQRAIREAVGASLQKATAETARLRLALFKQAVGLLAG
jgi:hypothetical protein